MVVLIIFPAFLQTVITFGMLSIGRQGLNYTRNLINKHQLLTIYSQPNHCSKFLRSV